MLGLARTVVHGRLETGADSREVSNVGLGARVQHSVENRPAALFRKVFETELAGRLPGARAGRRAGPEGRPLDGQNAHGTASCERLAKRWAGDSSLVKNEKA